MSTTKISDAVVFSASAAFAAADDEYARVGRVAENLPFENARIMTEPAAQARDRAGEALAEVTPTTLEGHAARALAVFNSAMRFVPEDFEEALDHLPGGLIQAVVQDLASAGFRPAPRNTADRDAELIRQCDEFADLSRRIADIYNVEFARDDAGADRAAEPHHQRREELLELICEAQATTIEGLKARGRMMVAYQGAADQFPRGPWPDSMIDALLRDLTGADGTSEGVA